MQDLEEGVRAGKYNQMVLLKPQNHLRTWKRKYESNLWRRWYSRITTYARDAKGNLTEIIDKELTTEQLKLKLSPYGFDSNANALEFKKSLGDKVKTMLEIKSLKAIQD
jgi:hypothetical protein